LNPATWRDERNPKWIDLWPEINGEVTPLKPLFTPPADENER